MWLTGPRCQLGGIRIFYSSSLLWDSDLSSFRVKDFINFNFRISWPYSSGEPLGTNDCLFHQKIPKTLSDDSPRPWCPLLLQFPTTDKSWWVTSYTCRTYIHSSYSLVPSDISKYSSIFREYLAPTALQSYVARIHLRTIHHTYLGFVHPLLFMWFTIYFEMISDLSKILCSLLLLRFLLPACIMVNSICLAVFIDVLCHYHFESLDSICCKYSQSSIGP